MSETQTADVDSIETRIDSLEQRIEDLEEENQDLRAENDRLRDRVEDLEDRPTVEYEEIDATGRPIASSLCIGPIQVGARIYDDDPINELEDRLLDVEERLEEASLGTTESTTETTETREEEASKLLSVVTWAENQAEEYLTANQKRARDIAKDLDDYTTKTPKGYVLRSRDVRTILSAWEGGRPHDETVKRVMSFLEKFAGDEEAEDVVRGGERRLYWTREAVERYSSAIPGTAHVVCEESPDVSAGTA